MYKPSRLLSSFRIAGFQYHDGALVLSKLKVGKKLDLVLEFDNPHDPDAVAIYRKGVHLGYVPRGKIDWIAPMMRFGHEDAFECRIVQIDPEAEPWDQVRVGIYVVDARAKSQRKGE